MKKTLYILFIISAILTGICMGIYVIQKTKKFELNLNENTEPEISIADKVTDECIDEYDEYEANKVEEANTSEAEKVSPNATILFEKYYRGCEHIVNSKEKIPNSLVNATREEVEEKYSSWTLKEFSNDRIVLFCEVDGECGEHYMLRDVDGKINIYKIDENGNEALLEETDIATEYLTSIDMINMENGLIVYGKESLNQLLEDFE